MDITTIPTSELEEDLLASERDLKVCIVALIHSIQSYSGGKVQERLDKNKHFIKVITAELERRRTMKEEK